MTLRPEKNLSMKRTLLCHLVWSPLSLYLKWSNNVLFMDKFFSGLNVTYSSLPIQGRALFPEIIVCRSAAQAGCGLLISVTTDTRNLDVIEWFAGVQEHRTIRNPHQLPVLFINPRNDIYVLCD